MYYQISGTGPKRQRKPRKPHAGKLNTAQNALNERGQNERDKNHLS